jgi:hypothetical protein
MTGSVVALALLSVFHLLTEWQRRTTLLALMRSAPGGTVVILVSGHGRPAMYVRVGHDCSRGVAGPIGSSRACGVRAVCPLGGDCRG